MSVKVTTPLCVEASLASFRADLFASLCCQSMKLHNPIGPASPVLQRCRLLLVPPHNPVQNARAPRAPASLSYYITSTCAKRGRGLVNAAVTRASRVNTKKPIGSSAGSRAPLKSLSPRALYLPEHPHFCLSEVAHGRHL